jgi:hypothetical protein
MTLMFVTSFDLPFRLAWLQGTSEPFLVEPFNWPPFGRTVSGLLTGASAATTIVFVKCVNQARLPITSIDEALQACVSGRKTRPAAPRLEKTATRKGRL